MPTTYTVPENPADPEAAALELIVRCPPSSAAPAEMREMLQDFAAMLQPKALRRHVMGRRQARGGGRHSMRSPATTRPTSCANRARNVLARHRRHGVAQPRACGAGVEHRGDGARAVSRRRQPGAVRAAPRQDTRAAAGSAPQRCSRMCTQTDSSGTSRHPRHGRGIPTRTARQPAPAPVQAPAAGAWAAMIDDYLRSLAAAGQRPATLHLRRDHLNRIARGIGCPPDDVTAERLVDWFGQQTHWKLETRRGYRNAARGFFAWAYKTGRVGVDLSDALPSVRQIMPAARPTPDDVWREAMARADARTRLMMRLAAEAGLRRGEVARVQTSDVLDGIDGARLVVNGKGGKVRILPISDSLADAIRPARKGTHPVRRRRAGCSPAGATASTSATSTSGFSSPPRCPVNGRCTRLRHRMASRAYRGTRNLRAVQVLLGHSSIATTERYLAVDDSEIRAAMVAAL